MHSAEYYLTETLDYPEMSRALGEQVSSVRSMISRDMLPAPILEDVEGERYFSRGEVEVILAVMRGEKDYKTRSTHDESARHNMHQHVHAYRSQYV